MNFIDSIIVNIIYIIFPLLCYLFYVSNNENFSKKNNEIFLEIALFSSIYLSMKVGNKSLLLINIPLIICFIKKRNICCIILEIVIICYYIILLKYNFVLVITEYVFYYFLYLIYKYRNLPKKYFVIIFLIFKIIMYTIYNYQNIYNVLINGGLFIIITILILYLVKKAENIASIHMNLKEIEKEKQIRNSLFKITHEIKNPIAVCKGYLDMFDKTNKEHVNKFIPILKSEINRTLTIMNDFMEFSKIKLSLEIMDIELLLSEVLDTFSNLLKEQNINLNYELIDEEIYINGDYNRLKQVFINIIKNSIEALDNISNANISVIYKIENDSVIIFIKDNGVGMDEETKNKMFEAFYTTKKCGTGLGVSLSKEIIEGHNGKIEYFSIKNSGTEVKITLPLMKLEKSI